MKTQRTSVIVFGFWVVFLSLYILVGLVLWRSGFLPQNRSFTESVVTVVFLLMMCLSPLGTLSSFSLHRAARKQSALHNGQKALELQTRSLKYLISGILDAVLGAAGYYVVSRRVFPQIDVMWIFFVLIMPPAFLQIGFR